MGVEVLLGDRDGSFIPSLGVLLLLAFLSSSELFNTQITYLKEVLRNQNRSPEWAVLPRRLCLARSQKEI